VLDRGLGVVRDNPSRRVHLDQEEPIGHAGASINTSPHFENVSATCSVPVAPGAFVVAELSSFRGLPGPASALDAGCEPAHPNATNMARIIAQSRMAIDRLFERQVIGALRGHEVGFDRRSGGGRPHRANPYAARRT
jgi:hypothetical protein